MEQEDATAELGLELFRFSAARWVMGETKQLLVANAIAPVRPAQDCSPSSQRLHDGFTCKQGGEGRERGEDEGNRRIVCGEEIMKETEWNWVARFLLQVRRNEESVSVDRQRVVPAPQICGL